MTTNEDPTQIIHDDDNDNYNDEHTTNEEKQLLEVEHNDDDDDDCDCWTERIVQSEWQDGVEIGLTVRWPVSKPTSSTNHDRNTSASPTTTTTTTDTTLLKLSTQLEPNHLSPLFDGTAWAGTRVWKAALLALRYMEDTYLRRSPSPSRLSPLVKHQSNSQSSLSLLELGCGLGVPGMVWHTLSTNDHDKYDNDTTAIVGGSIRNRNSRRNRVVLTDMPGLIPQLRHNIERNFGDSSSNNSSKNTTTNNNTTALIEAVALDWSATSTNNCNNDNDDCNNNNDNESYGINQLLDDEIRWKERWWNSSAESKTTLAETTAAVEEENEKSPFSPPPTTNNVFENNEKDDEEQPPSSSSSAAATTPEPPIFDIVLNCDCIYEPLYGRQAWEDLADVLTTIAKRSPTTTIITSVERRNHDGLELFMERFAQNMTSTSTTVVKTTSTTTAMATTTSPPSTTAPSTTTTASTPTTTMERVLIDDTDPHHVIEIYTTRGCDWLR